MTLHKRVMLRATLLVAGSAVALMGFAGLSRAADQSSDTPAAADTGTGAATDQLQEVVVTAERRAVDVQTTPIPITAISGSQLQAAQIETIQNLGLLTPSFSFETAGGNGYLLNIRGVGSLGAGAPDEQGVLIIRDGLPSPASEGFGENVPNYDVTDTEVLRGPQGTFVGDNSTGGAVEITSAKPNFRGISGYVDARLATYTDIGFSGAVNLPVSDTFAMRLAFYERTRNSFYFDAAQYLPGPYLGGAVPGGYPLSQSVTAHDPGNLDYKDGRWSMLWKPTDNFQSLTKLEVNLSSNDGAAVQTPLGYFYSVPGVGCPSSTAPGPGGTCHSQYFAGYTGSPFVINPWNPALHSYDNLYTYMEELQYYFPDRVELRSQSGIQIQRELNDSETSPNSLPLYVGSFTDFPDPSNVYTQEFDIISPTDGPFFSKLNYIAGINWFYRDEDQSDFGVNVGPPYSKTAPAYSIAPNWLLYYRQWAGFGQISWQITPTLQVQAGARLSGDNNGGSGGPITIRPAPLSRLVTVNGQNVKDDGVPTGKLTFNWTPLPGQFFYLFDARGYKPGVINLGAGKLASKLETINDIELGWKGTLANGHLQAGLDAYYEDYFHMIQSIFNPQNALGTTTANLPTTSTIHGVEGNLAMKAARFTLNLSGAWNVTKLGQLVNYATFKFPPGYGTTNQCAPGETPLPNFSNCTNYTPFAENLTGESLPYAPEFTWNATLGYAIPLFGDAVLEPRLIYSFSSHQYSALFQQPQDGNYYYLGARHLLNTYLDFTAGAWTVTAFVTNVTNELYLTAASYYGDPRQMGLEVNRTF